MIVLIKLSRDGWIASKFFSEFMFRLGIHCRDMALLLPYSFLDFCLLTRKNTDFTSLKCPFHQTLFHNAVMEHMVNYKNFKRINKRIRKIMEPLPHGNFD